MEVDVKENDLTDPVFKKKVVELLEAHQNINKKHLQLWTGVFIMTVLLWLFQLIQLVMG